MCNKIFAIESNCKYFAKFLDLNIYETIKKEKLNWKILICFFFF